MAGPLSWLIPDAPAAPSKDDLFADVPQEKGADLFADVPQEVPKELAPPVRFVPQGEKAPEKPLPGFWPSVEQGYQTTVGGVAETGEALVRRIQGLPPADPSEVVGDPRVAEIKPTEALITDWSKFPSWAGYMTGAMAPAAGGAMLLGPGVAGQIVGAGLGQFLAEYGPRFRENVEAGMPEDQALRAALKSAGVSGAGTGIAFGLPLSVVHLLLTQPGVGVAEHVVQNYLAGQPLMKDVEEAALAGFATGVPILGFKGAARVLRGKRARGEVPPAEEAPPREREAAPPTETLPGAVAETPLGRTEGPPPAEPPPAVTPRTEAPPEGGPDLFDWVIRGEEGEPPPATEIRPPAVEEAPPPLTVEQQRNVLTSLKHQLARLDATLDHPEAANRLDEQTRTAYEEDRQHLRKVIPEREARLAEAERQAPPTTVEVPPTEVRGPPPRVTPRVEPPRVEPPPERVETPPPREEAPPPQRAEPPPAHDLFRDVPMEEPPAWVTERVPEEAVPARPAAPVEAAPPPETPGQRARREAQERQRQREAAAARPPEAPAVEAPPPEPAAPPVESRPPAQEAPGRKVKAEIRFEDGRYNLYLDGRFESGASSREYLERQLAKAPQHYDYTPAPPPVPSFGRKAPAERAGKRQSLLQFIRAKGGILSTDPKISDARSILGGRVNPLIRKDGIPLDRLREAAAEAGYIDRDTDIRVLLDAMDKDARARAAKEEHNRVYPRGEEIAEARAPGEYEQAIEGHAKTVQDAFEREGLGGEVDTEAKYRAAEILHSGEVTDPFEAYDRAFRELEEKYAQRPGVRGGGEEIDQGGAPRAGPKGAKAIVGAGERQPGARPARAAPRQETSTFEHEFAKRKFEYERGRPLEFHESLPLRTALAELDLSHLTGVARKLAEFVRKRLSQIAGDTSVHFISERDLQDFSYEGKPDPNKRVNGLWVPSTNSRTGQRHQFIFINNDLMKFGNRETAAHSLMHEAMHAASSFNLDKNPKLKSAVRALMDWLEPRMQTKSGKPAREAVYAMIDEHEFLAEVFANPNLQEVMHDVPTPPAVSRALGTRLGSAWDSMVEIVRRLVGLPPGAKNIIDGAMSTSPSLLETALTLGTEAMKKPGEVVPPGRTSLVDWMSGKAPERGPPAPEAPQRAPRTPEKPGSQGTLFHRAIKEEPLPEHPGRNVERVGNTGGRWPDYRLVVDGVDLGAVKRKIFRSAGLSQKTPAAHGTWAIRNSEHSTRQEAEATLIQRAERFGELGPARKAIEEELIPGTQIPKQALTGTGVSHPGSVWDVVDRQTGKVMGTYVNRRRASGRVDKLDNEYGAYRYNVRRREVEPGTERKAVAEEAGAEGKPQLVIPGAERRPGEALKRRAEAPLKPKVEQKPADFGLFGTEKDQPDLFGRRRDETKALITDAKNEALTDKLMIRNYPTLSRTSGYLGGRKLNMTAFRAKVQDKMIRWKRIMEQWHRDNPGQVLPEEMDVYKAESLSHGKIDKRLRDAERDHFDPLIKEINGNGLTLKEVGEYAQAKHAIERNRELRKINPNIADPSGMSDARANAILAAARPRQGNFDAVYQRIRKMADDTIDMQVKDGLISQALANAWRQRWPDYVPMRHTEVGEGWMSVGKGVEVRGKESQRALGRLSEADNPIPFLMEQMQRAIVRGEHNRVGEAAYNFVTANPAPGLWSTKVPTIRYIDKKTGQVQTRVDPNFRRRDDVFTYKENGQDKSVLFEDPTYGKHLARALKNLEVTQLNGVMRAVSNLTRGLAMLSTTLNPEFMVSNFVRDAGEAMLNLPAEKQKGIVKSFAKHLMPSIQGAVRGQWPTGGGKYARYFREFEEAGGRVGFLGAERAETLAADINRKLKRLEGGAINSMWHWAGKAIGAIDVANTGIENGTRLAAYVAAREHGLSKMQAASIARELTVNFNRKGELGSGISALYMFANAGIQGPVRMMQALKSSKVVRRGAYALAAGSALLTIYNIANGGEDKDGKSKYFKIPQWERDMNFILMHPDGSGNYVKIPRPFGYGMFAAVGDHLAGYLYGNQELGKTASGITSSIVKAFNPLGGDQNLLALFTPTLAKPAVHLYTNRDAFDRPIHPDEQLWNKYLTKAEQRPIRGTSEVSQSFAKTLNELSGGDKKTPGWADVHPGTIDYLAGFAFGGLGRFAMNMWNGGSRLYQGQEWVPEKTPFVRRFYGESPTPGANRADYYEERKAVQAAGQRKTKGPEADAVSTFKATDKAISNLRKEIDKIHADDRLSAREKDDKVKKLEEQELKRMLEARRVLERNRARAEKRPAAFAEGGAVDVDSRYDTTLSPDEEREFRMWKSRYAPRDSGADYDLRGAYKAGLRPDPVTQHWPDTYKKPNHPTFSVESQYAKDRPDLAGRWQGETYIPPGHARGGLVQL